MSKKLLTPLIIALAAIITTLLLWKNMNHTSDWKSNLFALPHPEQITKFTFTSNSSKKAPLSFEKINNHWFVSSGNTKYLADTINIKQLLFWAMPKLLLRSPLSDQEKKFVDRDMALSATKATFYIGNEAVHTIYVGNSTQDNQATYMYYPGTNRPCIVEIPGFNGYLTPYFNTNIQLWRSVQLIETDPSNISELSVRWNLEPQNSFTIKQSDGMLSLFDASGKPVSCKKGLLAGYLFLCKDFAREAGEPAGINFDKKASTTLMASTPLISFDYTLQDKTKTTIHVYPMQEGAETVGINVNQNRTELQQTGLFWVKSNNDAYIWMTQDIILKNRMKKLSDFIN